MLGTIVALLGTFLTMKFATALPRKLKTKCSPETFKKYRLIVLACVFALMTAGIAISLALASFINAGELNVIGSLGASLAITAGGFGYSFISKALDIFIMGRWKTGKEEKLTPEDRRKGLWLLAYGLSLWGGLVAAGLLLL